MNFNMRFIDITNINSNMCFFSSSLSDNYNSNYIFFRPYNYVLRDYIDYSTHRSIYFAIRYDRKYCIFIKTEESLL